MTWNPARPTYSLPLGSEQYEIEGTFKMIDAVETALKESVLSVLVRCTEMPINQMARLVSAILTASGTKMSAAEAGEII